MAFVDYLWLIKLLIEILKLLAGMSAEDRVAIHNLHTEFDSITS